MAKENKIAFAACEIKSGLPYEKRFKTSAEAECFCAVMAKLTNIRFEVRTSYEVDHMFANYMKAPVARRKLYYPNGNLRDKCESDFETT